METIETEVMGVHVDVDASTNAYSVSYQTGHSVIQLSGTIRSR